MRVEFKVLVRLDKGMNSLQALELIGEAFNAAVLDVQSVKNEGAYLSAIGTQEIETNGLMPCPSCNWKQASNEANREMLIVKTCNPNFEYWELVDNDNCHNCPD
jgi:hypothetical protein